VEQNCWQLSPWIKFTRYVQQMEIGAELKQ